MHTYCGITSFMIFMVIICKRVIGWLTTMKSKYKHTKCNCHNGKVPPLSGWSLVIRSSLNNDSSVYPSIWQCSRNNTEHWQWLLRQKMQEFHWHVWSIQKHLWWNEISSLQLGCYFGLDVELWYLTSALLMRGLLLCCHSARQIVV